MPNPSLPTSPSVPPQASEDLTDPSPAALVDREGVRAGVDDALHASTAALRAELAGTHPDTDLLADATQELLAGGKRLRAAFCYWSWRAHGGDAAGPHRTTVLRAGAALELFQAAALFHDDVMDSSDTRRGRPTAHRAFAARHRDLGWSGDGVRYGENAAILLGDLALIASHRELGDALDDLAPAVATRSRRVFGRMQTEVTAGQYLDVHAQVLPWGEDPAADEERARAVIRSKSARYSVEHPIALGAALAGADDDAVAATSAFGLPVGEAFQLRDDVLGVFGDAQVTGKPAGDDLREGKRTVLVVRALAAATPAQRELLLTHLGDPDLDPATVEDLRAVLVETGARDAVESLIAELTERAAAALDGAGLAEPGATMLALLARAAVERTA
ncbi:polyprenyl synthetase family protein [Cellulosimicrobium sp. KWT-B]|uniref:polyprenyl synthetase family protein n=1 Tax=Cellulosimicrobium sp. KWT-B TaxID=1981152 RepID=UPI001E446D54|nr:polyprenyl synthetase family protein [Cellulosimicrobium sp. KWT-B]